MAVDTQKYCARGRSWVRTWKLGVCVRERREGESIYKQVAINMGSNSRNLKFSTHEVRMAPVPLGFWGKSAITIKNQGSTRTRVALDPPQGPTQLSVLLPNRQIDPGDSLLILFSFRNGVILDCVEILTFRDDTGGQYIATVYACADNSLLTTHAFVERNFNHLSFDASNGNTPQLVLKPGVTAEGFIERPIETALNQDGAAFLADVLSQNFLPHTISDLFGSLINSNGEMACKVIEKMSGLQIPGQMLEQLRSADITDNERISLLIQQFAAMLKWMVDQGCLLRSVKPEDLLSKADYVIFTVQSEIQDGAVTRDNRVALCKLRLKALQA